MSTQSLYLQNKIAVIWDFDKTLIPGYMQAPLFARFNVDQETFWRETKGYKNFFAKRGLELFSTDSYYLLHILSYVRAGRFPGLNNALLKELGSQLKLFPGLPEFFETLQRRIHEERRFRQQDIEVEHYIVSNGLRQMILGSHIGSLAKEVWGCEFVEELPEPGYLDDHKQIALDTEIKRVIKAVGYQIDNTSKTRAIFEINKGSRFNNVDVNDTVPYEFRPIPFQNMVYIADGKSDVPVFSILKQYEGRTFAVYDPSNDSFTEANSLLKQGRVDCIGPADYTPGTQAHYWISDAVKDIAERIVANRQAILGERIGRAPSHQADSDFSRTVVTQDELLDELKARRQESGRAPIEEAPVAPAEHQALIPLPAPTEISPPPGEYPAALIAACERVSDVYKPITRDEMDRLAVLIRSRAAARSEGGRRRGSAADITQISPQEIERHLDQMREVKAE